MGDGTDWLRKGFLGALVIGTHAALFLWQPAVWRTRTPASEARMTVVLLPPVPTSAVPAADARPSGATPLQARRRGTQRPQPAPDRIAPDAHIAHHADGPPPTAPGGPTGIDAATGRGLPLDLSYRPAPAGAGHAVIRKVQEQAAPKDSALATGFARAQRADCRSAYAHLGLLAIPRLLLEGKGEGCKW